LVRRNSDRDVFFFSVRDGGAVFLSRRDVVSFSLFPPPLVFVVSLTIAVRSYDDALLPPSAVNPPRSTTPAFFFPPQVA